MLKCFCTDRVFTLMRRQDSCVSNVAAVTEVPLLPRGNIFIVHVFCLMCQTLTIVSCSSITMSVKMYWVQNGLSCSDNNVHTVPALIEQSYWLQCCN